MSLNIKNPETYRLIRELAEATGESMTAAVTIAVSERLERLRGNFDVEEIRELAREIREALSPGALDVDHGELLYDEDGLPK
jgi:antitoxin VapB